MNVHVTSNQQPRCTRTYSGAIGVVSPGRGQPIAVFSRSCWHRPDEPAEVAEIPLEGGVLLELDHEGAGL